MTYADEWSQVHSTRADSKWDFRTVKGSAEETGLEQERVDRLLDEHQSENTLGRVAEPGDSLHAQIPAGKAA